MVIGIVILHTPPYQPLSEIDNSFFSLTKAFFAHGLFRTTVPVLTALSGYLVFHYNLHLEPVRLAWKKFTSIFIPLVIWNLPIAIAVFLSQKHQLLAHEFSARLYPFDLLNWLNAITGLLSDPVNYPLNFLRDLFVISLLAPLLWPLIKKAPYYGLILIALISYFNLDGPVVLRNSMLVNFYIGGLAATRKWNLEALDEYAVWFLMTLFGCCALIVALRIENRELFRLISPFLIWPCMRLIIDTRLGDWLYKYSACSFFTYLSHSVALLALWIIFQKTPLENFYIVYWVMAPLVTVLLLIFLCQKFKLLAPRLSSLLLGGRS